LASVEQYANSVKDYVTQNRLRELVLVGHSMGGAIAIEYALRDSTLRGLVLVGTGARLRVRPEFLSELKENYEGASKMIASWSVSPGCNPVIVERLAKDLLKVKPDVTLGDFIACNNFDRMKDVDTIALKTLIICGADDKMTPVRYSQYLHEKIKGSKLVVIPNAGHAVMLERHRTFNRALEDFLDSL
jgi:pimeloyl-ACP methyl ester carboxylesterase